VYDPVGGRVGFYQKPASIFDSEGGFQRIYGWEVSSGSTGALQSGMFSIERPLTADVRTQWNPDTYAKSADAGAADVIRTNPSAYSRMGAEAYGGVVTPLDSRTLSPNAVMGRYDPATGNLANLVDPSGVNRPRSELQAVEPWGISADSPVLQTMSGSGFAGTTLAPTSRDAYSLVGISDRQIITGGGGGGGEVSVGGGPGALPMPFRSTSTNPKSVYESDDPTMSVMRWAEGAKSDFVKGISGITLPESKPTSVQDTVKTGARNAFAMFPPAAIAADVAITGLFGGKKSDLPFYETTKSVSDFLAPPSTVRSDYEKSLGDYQKDVAAFTGWQKDYDARVADFEKTKSPATYQSDLVKYGQLQAEYSAMDATYKSLLSREGTLKQQASAASQEKTIFDKLGAVWESVNKDTAVYTSDVTGMGRYIGAVKVDESTATGKVLSFGKQFYAEQTQYPVELALTYGAGKALTIGESALKHGVASAAMSNKPVIGGAGRWLSGVGVEDTVKIAKVTLGGIIVADATKNIIEQPTFELKGGAAGRTVLQFAGFGAGAIKTGIATEAAPNRMSTTLVKFNQWVNAEPANDYAGRSFITGKPTIGPLSSVNESGRVGLAQVELAARGKVQESRALGQAYEIFTAVRGTQPYNAKAKVNLWDLQEVPWEHKVVLDKYLGEEPHSLFGSGVQQVQGVPADKVPAGKLGITPSADIDILTNPKTFMQKLGSTEGAVVLEYQGYEVPGRVGKWVPKIEGGYEQVPSRVSYGGKEFAVDIHGIPVEYPMLPAETAGRPSPSGYKQEWQELLTFKVLGDPFAVTPRSWQLTNIKDKSGNVVQTYEHADIQRYRLMDAFRKDITSAASKDPAVARGGRFEKDTVRLLSAFEDAIQTERLGRGGFGKTTPIAEARANDLLSVERRLTGLKEIEISYRPGVSSEKAFLENTVGKAVESDTTRQIPIWERAIRTEQSRLNLRNPKDASRYLELVEAQKQITILTENPAAAKDIRSVKLGDLQEIAAENLGYGLKMSGEPLETPVSLGNLKGLGEYKAPQVESPLKWSVRTKQPAYGSSTRVRKLSEMPAPERVSTSEGVDAWLKKTGQKIDPMPERSFESSRKMERDIFDEFEDTFISKAGSDSVVTIRSPEIGTRSLFTGTPMPSGFAPPDPQSVRQPSGLSAMREPPVRKYGIGSNVATRPYTMASPVPAMASPMRSPQSQKSPALYPLATSPLAAYPMRSPLSPQLSPRISSPVTPLSPIYGFVSPRPSMTPAPTKFYTPKFPDSPPPPVPTYDIPRSPDPDPPYDPVPYIPDTPPPTPPPPTGGGGWGFPGGGGSGYRGNLGAIRWKRNNLVADQPYLSRGMKDIGFGWGAGSGSFSMAKPRKSKSRRKKK
jgi:hypothetical protein